MNITKTGKVGKTGKSRSKQSKSQKKPTKKNLKLPPPTIQLQPSSVHLVHKIGTEDLRYYKFL